MALLRLNITNFRNLISANIEPLAHGFNFVFGNNGSGKTSLLEAIYYLSLNRSFRSSTINRVINKTADKFAVFAHVLTESNQSIPVGMERPLAGEFKIRISNRDVRSAAELASIIPVQLINSSCFNLLDTPAYRRKYLDWGAFYLSTEFFRVWRLYEQALKQRNAALRQQLSPDQLAPWTQELIENALQLDRFRREYVQNLIPLLLDGIDKLLPIKNLEISYQAGWDDDFNYADVLTKSLYKDLQLGYTQYGPHRADFKIIVNNMPAKDILSRGQQKLFVCAMILAQGTLLRKHTNKKPIYLVDDLPAELDMTSRSNLMSLLSQHEAQVFVTAVERDTLEDFFENVPMKMFHVEHGNISELIDCVV
jgi:DNA replication and repair protein RecF